MNEEDVPPLPVTVVTGFLGAGKTTLLGAWLREVARGDIAVVVNEVGEVGVDGELLRERVRTLVEITGGCVCCRTQGELVAALATLARAEPRPRRIVVETSGAASPAGVLRAIARGGATRELALDGVVTTMDASRIEALEEHELAIEQIAYADVVVLTRGDRCDAPRIEAARARVAEWNEAALVVSSAHGVLAAPGPTTLDALLDASRTALPVRPEPRAPHAERPHVYASVSLRIAGEVDGERFADFVSDDLARMGGRVFRTKGILAVAGVGERMIVQGALDLVEIVFGAPWRDHETRTSRLVVVGYDLDREALARAFAACAVRKTG